MNDLNFHSLDVEANIYAMATLEGWHTKLALIALRDCQVCCIEYKNHKPYLRKIQFAYLPTGGRILSIRVLKRKPNDFIIAIAHCQLSDLTKQTQTKSRSGQIRVNPECREQTHGREYYLNLYSSARSGALDGKLTFEIDAIASCCQTIHLRSSPAFVLPLEFMSLSKDSAQPQTECFGFLVPGGDHQVHVFLDNSMQNSPTSPSFYDLEESSAEDAGLYELPKTLDSKPVWLDLAYYFDRRKNDDNFERWTCFGMENGSFYVYRGVYSKILRKFQLCDVYTRHFIDTIIPSVRFFTINSTYPSPVRQFIKIPSEKGLESNHRGRTSSKKRTSTISTTSAPIFYDGDAVNLLVVNGTGNSFIYEDIVKHALDKEQDLPDSQRKDVAVTSCIADINMDGKNEILIGGYGDELLTFQYDDETCCYYLDTLKLLNEPVYSILALDFTNNATKNTLLLLSNGVLIAQPHVVRALNVAERRLELIGRCFFS